MRLNEVFDAVLLLLLLSDEDLRERHIGQIGFRIVIDDDDIGAAADDFAQFCERNIAALRCIVEFSIGIALDSNEFFFVIHDSLQLAMNKSERFRRSRTGNGLLP